MYKEVLKKTAALFLCACMIGTSVDVSGLTVYAAQEQAAENQTEEKETTRTTDTIQEEQETVTQEESGQSDYSALEAALPLSADDVPSLGSTIDISGNETIIRIATTNLTYDGTEKKPSFQVSYNGEGLASTYYDVDYKNNINAGTATITITGKNGYTGQKTATFDIARMNITSNQVKISPTPSPNPSYTGYSIDQRPTITHGSNTLSEGNDYNITYNVADRVAVGTKVEMTIEGIGNYTGTKLFSYEITKMDVAKIPAAEYTYTDSYEYTGSPIELTDLYITNGGEPLEKDTDYTVSYMNNTSAGTATATIRGKGNYSGTKQITYTIAQYNLASSTITFTDEYTFTYDGTKKKPPIKVVLNAKTLTEGIDYEASYPNPVNRGEPEVVVTGKGNYTGTASKSYTINPASIDSAGITVETIGTQYYTGSGVTPKPKVWKSGTELVEGTDYTLTYGNNIDVTETANVYINGQNNYEGTKTVTFKIAKVKMSMVTIEDIEDWRDLARDPKPTVKATYNGETLVERRDYTIEYLDENGTTLQAGVTGTGIKGRAVLTAAAGSVYEGSTEKTFWICDNINKTVVTASPAEYVYTGKEISPTPTVRMNDIKLEEGVDYEVIPDADPINVGDDKSMTIKGIGNYAGTTKCSYKITQRPLTAGLTWEAISPIYTGSELFPRVTLKYEDITLCQDVDYTIEKDAGTANEKYVNAGADIPLVLKAKSGGNYTGELPITYTIQPRQLADASGNKVSNVTVEGLDGLVETYTGNDITVDGKIVVKWNGTALTKDTDYTISYENNRAAGNAVVKITGKGNYGGTIKESFAIKYDLATGYAKGITVDAEGIAKNEFEYDGGVGHGVTPQVKVTFDDEINGIHEVLTTSDYTIAYSNNELLSTDISPAQITVTGKGNYSGKLIIDFKVVRKDIANETDIIQDRIVNIPTYDGTEHRANPTLRHHGTKLEPGVSCNIVSYQDTGDADDDTVTDKTNSPCKNAGTVTVTMEGKGNYCGTRTTTYEIKAKDFTDTSEIKVTKQADIPYDGAQHKLTEAEITAQYTPSGKSMITMTEKDYKVTSWVDTGDAGDETVTDRTDSPCINAGTVTITLTANGKNYTGVRTIKYDITRKPLVKSDGSLEDDIQLNVANGTEVTYNREVQDPQIELSSTVPAIGTLKADTDYTVLYEKETSDGSGTYQTVDECKDAGKYRVTITGIRNFVGSYIMEYTILPRDLNETGDKGEDYRFSITELADQTYTGDEIIPEELEVFEYTINPSDLTDFTQNKVVLEEGDYEVVGTNNLNVTGDGAKAILTITGTGNYVGTLTTEFVILPKNINDMTDETYDVALTEILEEEYITTAITPELPLVYNGHPLTSTDYTVNYEVNITDEQGVSTPTITNINVGPAYGTITGQGNYTGTRVFTAEDPIFRIIPRSVKNAYDAGELTYIVAEETGPVIYDGLEHKPEVTLKDTLGGGEKSLEVEKDYVVIYDDGVAAGEHHIVIEGRGNYGDSIELTYTIYPKSLLTGSDENARFIEGSSISNIVDLIYTGGLLTQEPVITDTISSLIGEEIVPKEVTLEEGKDYTLSYSNNQNASTDENKAVVTVTFCGNYTGYYDVAADKLYNDYKTTFTIYPRDIAEDVIVVEDIPNQSYNKNPIVCEPRITYGQDEAGNDRVLVKNTDYTLEYSPDCTNQGTVTVTIKGQKNFTGQRTTTYKILPKSLDTDKSPDIVVASIPAQIYTGKNIVPDVTVTYGNTVLEKGVDYETVAGTNTVTPGTATVVIEGIGNYSEQRIVSFKIMGNLGTDGTIEAIPVQAYTGNQITPSPKVTFKGTELTEGVDYDVIYDNNTEVGTATFTVVGKDGYYTGTKSIVFKIAYDISQDTMERQTIIADVANAYTYTSGTIKPIPTITYGGTELKQGTDYTLSYTKNINTGTAEITITGQNRYMGSVTKKFTIVKKNLANCTFSTIQDFVYDGNAKTPSVVVKNGTTTLISGVDYTVKYQTNKEAGVGKMILTGSNNYSGTVIRYFNIKVAAPKSLKMTSNAATSIKLSWNAGGKVTGYEIYRLESDGKYKRIATTSKTTYTNTKLKNAKTYKYKVRAYYKSSTGKVYSSFTGVLTTNTTPETPKIVLSSTKAKQIKIKWSKLNLGTGYEVYQSTSKNGKYKKIAKITNYKTTSYTKKSLTSKKTYYYKVRAYKTINGKKVYGKYSSIKSKKAK